MSTSLSIGGFNITTVQDHQGMDRNPTEVYSEVPAAAWDPYRSFALDPDGFYRSQWRGHLISPQMAGRRFSWTRGWGPAHTSTPASRVS